MIRIKRNKNGFTLMELMLTILIMTLAGIAMANGFRLVQNSYNKLTEKANAETLISTTINEVSDRIRYAERVETDEEGKNAKFFDANKGYLISIDNPDPENDNEKNLKGIIIRYYTGEKVTEVHQLLSDNTMIEGLTPKIEDLKLEKAENGNGPSTATFKISIYNKNMKPIESQTVTVSLLNS